MVAIIRINNFKTCRENIRNQVLKGKKLNEESRNKNQETRNKKKFIKPKTPKAKDTESSKALHPLHRHAAARRHFGGIHRA